MYEYELLLEEALNEGLFNKEYEYYVSNKSKVTSSSGKYLSKTERDALIYYLQYGHHKLIKGDGYMISNKELPDYTIYLYRVYKNKFEVIDDGKLQDMCVKYDISIKTPDANIKKDREKIYQNGVKIFNQVISKYPGLKRGAKIVSIDDDINSGFINGANGDCYIADIDPYEIASNMDPRSDEFENEISIPLNNLYKDLNKKCPKGQHFEDYGDWDAYSVTLVVK